MPVTTLLLVLASAALHATWNLWTKQIRSTARGGAIAWLLTAIAALSPLSYLLMLFALRDGAVSHVAPAREISILIGTWLGGQVLGEGDRVRRLAAAGALVAGVILLALA